MKASKGLIVLGIAWLVGAVAIVMQFRWLDDRFQSQERLGQLAQYYSNIREARFCMRQSLAYAALYDLHKNEKYQKDFNLYLHSTKEFLSKLRTSVGNDTVALNALEKLDLLRAKILEERLNPLMDEYTANEASHDDLQRIENEVRPLMAEFDFEILKMKNYVPPRRTRTIFEGPVGGLLAGDLIGLTVGCAVLGLLFRSNAVSQPLSPQKGQVTAEQSLIEHAVDVICLLNPQLQFVSANPSARNMWGYTPDELRGRTLTEFIVEEDIKATTNAFVGIEHSIDKIGFENRFKKKDGSIIHVLWSVHWSVSDQGLFCVAHDITERKETEELKRELMAMISHDLRTPLASIKALLELIEEVEGQINEKTLNLVSRGREETERLICLVNDLLDVEKMHAGKFSMEYAPTKVSDVMEISRNSVQRLADVQNLKLELPTVDHVVEADARRLTQVMVNLLSNAIKYSSPGGSIKVESEVQNDHLRISVSDTGRGIDQDQLKTIFDKFEQIEKNAAAQYTGTGLGLAICKAIVEQHSGTIGVESELWKGTTFWFLIPTKRKPEQKDR